MFPLSLQSFKDETEIEERRGRVVSTSNSDRFARREFETRKRPFDVSLSKKPYRYCLVLAFYKLLNILQCRIKIKLHRLNETENVHVIFFYNCIDTVKGHFDKSYNDLKTVTYTSYNLEI